jgi:hypothetical protein
MTTVSQPDDGRVSQPAAGPAEHDAPQSVSPATPWGRLASPALQNGIALLIYLVVWLATAFRPIVIHITRMALDQKSQDPSFYTWSMRWWPYAVAHGLNPLYTHEIAAPAGHSLAWVTTVPPLALLTTPLTLLAGPVVSFNLLAAAALPVSAWAAFLLCRRLTGQFWAALVGGAVFGFSAYEMFAGAIGQLNLVYSLMLPILAYIIVVWWQRGMTTRTFVILAALTMAVQFYLFLETFADMTGFLAISLVLGFALAQRADRPVIVRLGKLLGLAYVIAIVLAAPYLAYAFQNKPPRPVGSSGMDLASLVIPRSTRTFGITWLAHAAAGPYKLSAACYVGVPLLVLVVLLAVTAWQSRLVRLLSCMLVIIVVAALGPVVYLEGHPTVALPWAKLFHLPLVRNAYPLRLMLFAYLVLAVAAAIWLAGPAKRVPWARWPLAVLVILFIALDVVPIKVKAHTEVPTYISAGQYRHELSRGEIVVVVSYDGNAGMLWQAQSDFYMRIAGGYINEGINHRTDLPRPVAALADATPAHVASFEKFVKTHHVGAILVDASDKPVPGWVRIFRMLGLVGHTTGGVVVYQIDGCRSCLVPDHAGQGKQALATA